MSMLETDWYRTFRVHRNRRPRKALPISSCHRFLEEPRPTRAVLRCTNSEALGNYPDFPEAFVLKKIRRPRMIDFLICMAIHLRLADYKFYRMPEWGSTDG